MNDKTWTPQPGEQAAVWSSGGSWAGPTVRMVTVERLTGTQIVIEGSSTRYRRDNLRQVGNHYGSELRRADDPMVREVLEQARVRDIALDLSRVLDAADRKVRSTSDAGELLAVLGQIEQAVAVARATVEKLEGDR